MRQYPLVMVSFQDHAMSVEGDVGPYLFVAIGALVAEDDMGYYLAHWVKNHDSHEQPSDGASYVAKVKGLQLIVLGTLQLED